MEPFIQLSYGEQCPRKSSKLTETSFIDKRKVSELFWIDLLETKCQEGVCSVWCVAVCCHFTVVSSITLLSLPDAMYPEK